MWLFGWILTSYAQETVYRDVFALQNPHPTQDSGEFIFLTPSGLGRNHDLSARAAYSTMEELSVLGAKTLSRLDIGGGYTLGPLRYTLNIPTFLSGSVSNYNDAHPLLGQPLASIKYQFWQQDALGMAFKLKSTLTATDNSLLDAPQTVGGEFIGDLDRNGFLLAANLGYHFQYDGSLVDQDVSFPIYYRIGAGRQFETHGLSLEYLGSTITLSEQELREGELVLGGWKRQGAQHYSVALSQAMNNVALSPRWKIIFSVYSHRREHTDSDQDGIIDRKDQCIHQAEDIDNTEDWDGCPESNSSRVQTIDHEAGEIEKISWNYRTQATEGLTSLRTEASQFEAMIDEERSTTESSIDAHEDDQILGTLKLIVLDENEEEIEHAVWIFDGNQRIDHYPSGAIVPLLKGKHDIIVRAEGFRQQKERIEIQNSTVEIIHLKLAEAKVKSSLELSEKIYFKTGSHEIDERSHALLDEVAEVLHHQAVVELVHIEGHTDAIGNAETNQKISQERADAVRSYLLQKGVERDRLVAIGYGEEQPIDTNDTESGRANNRRVIFVIKKRHDDGAE